MTSLGEGGASIKISNLCKRYGSVRAVDCVDLEIRAGEFVSLLGPSGSGKTTTLMMIAGFVAPDQGDIEIGGNSIVSVPPYKRDIGMVFQSYALFPHMRVCENVAYPLQMRRLERAELDRRVAAILDLVGLPAREFGSRYPRQLSGGQQQRVALARALVYEPSVLLMDEPLGALDRKLRAGMQLEIKRLHQRLGLTVVYVTHDQEEALILSDRIAIYQAGQIVQVDGPVRLYERPRTEFVAAFIGESNFLEVEARNSATGTICWHLRDGTVVGNCDQASSAKGVMVLRPEALRLVEPKDAILKGKVSEAVYVGGYWRYLIDTAAGQIIARVTAAGIPVTAVGELVGIAWDSGAPVMLSEPFREKS